MLIPPMDLYPWDAQVRLGEISQRAHSARWLLDRLDGGGNSADGGGNANGGDSANGMGRRLKFDCIVVGAGSAGSTAALFLAQAGLEVLLLERGPYPGSKNMGGGALYAQMMQPLLGEFWREAPLEGAIVNQEYWFLTEEGAVSTGVRNAAFDREPYNRFSVLKARFDPWLARQAQKAGARLLVNHKVDELIVRDGRVTGVAVGFPFPQEFHAPAVILAEGSNALLATRAGLVPKVKLENMSLYAKAVITLPPEVIRERFALAPGQAAVIGFIGYNTQYLTGTASLYTCRDCIGINAGSILTEQQDARVNTTQFMRNLLEHPFLRPYLADGRLVEHTARLIPDGGFHAMPELVHPGVLIVGDTAGLVNGTQGINLAAYSGKFAAEAVVAAHEKGDFSREGLHRYRELMEDSFIIKDLKAHGGVPAFYNKHKDVMNVYPKLLNELAYQVAMVYPLPKREKRRLLGREFRTVRSLSRTARDLLAALRVMR